MEIELEFSLSIDGASVIYGRKMENGGPSIEFCADVQTLRCTLSELMKTYIEEHCK